MIDSIAFLFFLAVLFIDAHVVYEFVVAFAAKTEAIAAATLAILGMSYLYYQQLPQPIFYAIAMLQLLAFGYVALKNTCKEEMARHDCRAAIQRLRGEPVAKLQWAFNVVLMTVIAVCAKWLPFDKNVPDALIVRAYAFWQKFTLVIGSWFQ